MQPDFHPQEDEDTRKNIPACQRCRIKKIKCDREAPKCAGCTKARNACIVVDPVTSERYSRESIRQLQEREKALQDRLDALSRNTPPQDTAAPMAMASPVSLAGHAAGAKESPRGFVGDGSGLGFLRSIVLDRRWHAYRAQILRHLSERPTFADLVRSPNPQPSLEEASVLLENYFTRFHIQHTFLLRQDVLNIFHRVYHGSDESQRPSSQDHFRLYMIFALSAVSRNRLELHLTPNPTGEHPFGYFLASLPHLANIPLLGHVDAIPNLLLVCRFGMYYNIGTSLWDISQFCMRQCIEHGLHQKPQTMRDASTAPDLVKEQERRRVFWECYILDRWSSCVLDRPFAIAEDDITVEMPLDISDRDILEAQRQTPTLSTLSQIALPGDSPPTELSVFLFCVRLRRITTRIQSAFYNNGRDQENGGDHHDAAGHVYVRLYELLDELVVLRQTAPVFAAPRSLYERPEWYDFLLEKDRLSLVRGALMRVPRRSLGADANAAALAPPQDLLALCFDSATRIISLFQGMQANGRVSWTRSYFQVVFVAGLSLIYCVSLGLQHSSSLDACKDTLGICDSILASFRQKLPDSGRFAVVFGILKDQFFRDPEHGGNPAVTEAASRASIAVAASLPPQYSRTAWSVPHQPLHPSHPSHPSHAAAQELPLHMHNEHDPTTLPLSYDHMGYESWQAGNLCMLPPDHHPYSDNTEAAGQDDFSAAWPALTEEMMEQLEAGLGEFAWGAVGTGNCAWDGIP